MTDGSHDPFYAAQAQAMTPGPRVDDRGFPVHWRIAEWLVAEARHERDEARHWADHGYVAVPGPDRPHPPYTATVESYTDMRQVLVGNLHRLAAEMRCWDRIVAALTAKNDPEAEALGQYRAGLRSAVALAMLGTTHADTVDEWVAGLLDTDEQEETA